MEIVGATYYYRRAVPEYLRPYFLTATGKLRTEFKISLRMKDKRQAKVLLELKAVEIPKLFVAAERKFAAGIPPHKDNSAREDVFERWQEEQLELREQDDHEQGELDCLLMKEDEAFNAYFEVCAVFVASADNSKRPFFPGPQEYIFDSI